MLSTVRNTNSLATCNMHNTNTYYWYGYWNLYKTHGTENGTIAQNLVQKWYNRTKSGTKMVQSHEIWYKMVQSHKIWYKNGTIAQNLVQKWYNRTKSGTKWYNRTKSGTKWYNRSKSGTKMVQSLKIWYKCTVFGADSVTSTQQWYTEFGYVLYLPDAEIPVGLDFS